MRIQPFPPGGKRQHGFAIRVTHTSSLTFDGPGREDRYILTTAQSKALQELLARHDAAGRSRDVLSRFPTEIRCRPERKETLLSGC
jgi:hypothetical protein